MIANFSRTSAALVVLGLATLVACADKPTLLSKNAAVPVGIDLSGQWLVRKGENVRRPVGHSDSDSIVIDRSASNARSRARKSGSSVHVFLEYGKSLKITQTDFGLFISFDRSVVEEYRFGENRPISIGPIEASRVSGWEGGAFVVETLDDSYAILSESWVLQDEAKVLVRNIQIMQKNQELFSTQQIFDRQ